MMARFDTILMGRRTFEAAQAQGGGESMPGGTTIVVSRTLRQEDHPGLMIIAEDVGGAVSRLRADSGKDIWLFGGGSLFRSLLDLGLVDTIEVGVIPVLLARRIRRPGLWCWSTQSSKDPPNQSLQLQGRPPRGGVFAAPQRRHRRHRARPSRIIPDVAGHRRGGPQVSSIR
jgi:dihydrofolate reductase